MRSKGQDRRCLKVGDNVLPQTVGKLKEVNMSEHTSRSVPNSDAKFLGWQDTLSGESFALYNITAEDHPSFGSTVSEISLQKLNLQVPDAPHPDDTGEK
jgi:hypothetical protein